MTAPTNAPPQELKARDISHVAASIRALMRASGIKGNHDRTINAALAAATHHGSNEFSTYQSELGALMDDVVAPYRREIPDEDQARQYYRAKSQKWKRAYKSLADEQVRTGYWFVTMESGGINDENEKQGSKIVVDIETISKTIQRATRRGDYKDNPRRAFEQAAKIALADKPKVFTAPHDPLAAHRPDNENIDPAKRNAKCFIAFAYRLYQDAEKQNAIESHDDLCALRESLKRDIDQLFDVRIAAEREAKSDDILSNRRRQDRMESKLQELQISRKFTRNENFNLQEIKDLPFSLVLKTVAASAPETVNESEYTKGVEYSEVSTTEPSPLGASAPSPAARSRLENDDSLHGYICLSQDQKETPPPSDLLSALREDRGEIDVVSPTVSRELPPTARADAAAMLDAFESIGIDRVHVLLRDADEKAKPRGWFESQTKAQTLFHLERAERDQLRLEIRWPKLVGGVAVIQLDDITASTVRSVKSISLCVIETSLENFQAFVAVGGVGSEAQRDSLRRRMILGARADKGANGSAKLAGSLNVKENRRRPDGTFPRVGLVAVNPGSLVGIDELELAGLPDDPRPPPPPMMVREPPPRRALRGAKREPSYQISLNCAPPRADRSGQDRSVADFIHAGTCLKKYGFSIQETEDIIRRFSDHAREKESDPATYIRNTVRNADTLATSPYLSQ